MSRGKSAVIVLSCLELGKADGGKDQEGLWEGVSGFQKFKCKELETDYKSEKGSKRREGSWEVLPGGNLGSVIRREGGKCLCVRHYFMKRKHI